ncbi:U3 small nucleolar RNA-associated protein [Spathaspora sp. JA1]|nr:U3 small nucleolar RNA-associated protein [Spathaspora sp. JA1]
MPRPIGFTPEDEGAKKKWDAWKREGGISKTEAKRRYIAYLIDTMRVYASGTVEARELLNELEYLWDQIKDVQFSPDDELKHHNFTLPSRSPSFIQGDRYSTNGPPSVSGRPTDQFRTNLEKIYSHSRRNTMVSLNDYINRGSVGGSQRLATSGAGGATGGAADFGAGSVYSMPLVDRGSRRGPGDRTNISSDIINDFKAWQGEVNLIINKLTKEFVRSRKEGDANANPEYLEPLDPNEIMKQRIINILKIIGMNVLKIIKNFSISLVTMLFIIWYSSESLRLFSIGGSTYITEWDLATGKPLTNYDCNAGIIWSIDISADNTKLAVGCDDGSVVIVDISGGRGTLEYDLICQRQDSRVLSIKWVDNRYSFLISGGVERAIVIQHVEQFHDGKYKKLLINQQKSNVVVNKNKRLIFMWQDQTVKIWRATGENEKPKLVCKLSLSDDENITSIDFNEESSLLAVSKLTSVRLFQLEDSKASLKVHKIRDRNFDSLIEGAKLVKFIAPTKFLVLTSDEELYKYEVNLEEGKINLEDEIELISKKQQGKVPYSSCIKNLIVTPNGDNLVISRFNGSIEIYSLGEKTEEPPYVLTKLSNNPHLLTCSGNDKLLVLSEDNKILEFFINQKDNNSNLLTPWSRRNSEFLPQQFTYLEDKPQGMFVKDEKVWIFGSTWVAYFDLTLNIPISKAYKNTNNNAKKRTRNGLSINEEDLENDMEESVDILKTSLKQSEIDRLRQQIQDDEQQQSSQQQNGSANTNRKPFFVTEKYRPIMKVADFGATDEIVVIERPYFALPSTPAFNLPKLKI